MTFEHFSILQIAEQLQLTPSILLTELANGKINFSDSNRTLRENFPHNDEKIFAAITIALKLRFQPQPEKDVPMEKKLLCIAISLACLPAYAENVFTLGQIAVIGEKASDLSTARIDQAELQKNDQDSMYLMWQKAHRVCLSNMVAHATNTTY